MSNPLLKILLLEDSLTDAEIVRRVLSKGNIAHEFRLAVDKATFLTEVDEFSPDVILSDHSLPQFSSSEALEITRQKLPHAPFILVTGTASEEYAANIIKLGADDYILKDRMARLPSAIEAALIQRRTIKEITDYRYALDQSAIVSITNQKGMITYANDNFCEISKYSKEELLGRDHSIVNSGYHPASYIRELWATIARGKVWRGEFCNRAKDGSIYWVDSYIIPFLNDKNKPYQYLSIRTDITKKKRAEEELRKSFIRLNEAQALTHISNWEFDFLKKEMTWSNEYYRILGVDRKEIKPSMESFLGKVHPEDRPAVQQNMDDSFRELSDASQYFRIIRSDGKIRHVYSEWKFEIDRYKSPMRVYGILQDITERTEAEEALRKSNERFKFATQASSDIIWELNFETKEYTVHEGKERLFGVNKAINWQLGIEGKYIVEGDRERVRKSFAAARRNPGKELWQDEYRVYSSANSTLVVINHAIFIRDKEGKALKAVGAITDITERKKLEAQLIDQQRREQLRITATALEAQEKERNAIGQELHDNVNQILVGTKLLLSMVKNDPEKNGHLVASCINNLQNAIDENRKIAHALVAPDLELETLEEQLNRLMSTMLHTAGMEAKIESGAFEDHKLDKARKLAVYRIAQEQCTNIVKYSRATSARIVLETHNGTFLMKIADNGQGMDTQKKTEGIGLRNIYGRLSVFNGKARVETAPGKGFLLEIEIPV